VSSWHGRAHRARWTDEHGKRQSRTFHHKRDADLFEQRMKVRVQEVRHGLRAALPVDRPFDELCDTWLKNRASQKRSEKHDKSIIRAHLRPALGKLKVRDVGVEAVDRFVRERSHLDKKTVGNHLTLLVSMLNYAHDLAWLERVPRIRKPRVPFFSTDFAFLRTAAEIQRFLVAAREEGEHIFVLYAAAVYTGMRAGELAGLHWDDVNFDRRLITVQRSFGGPTKADEVRYVPIVDALLPHLRAWRLRHPGALVFANERGTMLGPSARPFQEILHRVLERAGFQKVTRKGKERWYITFHSLRHTFASHWVMNGGDLFKLQKVLGHKSAQMTLRYAHLAPHAFEADHGRFEVIATASAVVVPMRDAASAQNRRADELAAVNGNA